MKKQVRIFLTGAVVLVPFALTVYLVWWAGAALDRVGRSVLPPGAEGWLFPGVGAIAALAAIYLVGLLMHWCVFRWVVRLLEGLMERLPVVKSVYESIRDILKLFAGDSRQMGQVVRYRLPGTDAQVLGIQTSTSPRGAEGLGKVAVYLPLSYMIGGWTVYVAPEALEPVDMSVEEALKIAATAEATPARPASVSPRGR